MSHKPYHTEAANPDEDHPRAGWYIKIDEDGGGQIFGPFATEPHAEHFAEHVLEQDHHH